MTTLAGVVIDCLMLGGSVVPNRHRASAPTKPTSKLRLCAMVVKEIQQRLGFFFGPAFKMSGEISIHIEPRSARQGMSDDNRLLTEGKHTPESLALVQALESALINRNISIKCLDADVVRAINMTRETPIEDELAAQAEASKPPGKPARFWKVLR